MSDLRNMLDREANRISAKPSDVLDGVIRTADRRHRRRQAVAGFTALAVVAGVALGAWSLLGNQPDVERPNDPRPTLGAEKWPANAWPHTTREEARTAQQHADENDPEYLWQLDVEAVAERYGMEVLGWAEVGFDESLDGVGDAPSITLYAASCQIGSGGIEPCEGTGTDQGDQEALVTLERLINPGQGGVWTVTAVAGPNDLRRYANFMYGRLPIGYSDQACPTNATIPDAAEIGDATRDLMAGANGNPGAPETVWKWLDAGSHPAQGDPDLFAYHFRNTTVTSEYAEWEVAGETQSDFPDGLAVAERCGQEVRDALLAVQVYFPNVGEGQESSAILVWVGHPEGVRLWMVPTPENAGG